MNFPIFEPKVYEIDNEKYYFWDNGAPLKLRENQNYPNNLDDVEIYKVYLFIEDKYHNVIAFKTSIKRIEKDQCKKYKYIITEKTKKGILWYTLYSYKDLLEYKVLRRDCIFRRNNLELVAKFHGEGMDEKMTITALKNKTNNKEFA